MISTGSFTKDLLKQAPEQADSREQLREMLAARKSRGIIFPTIQKFSMEDQESNHPVLPAATNHILGLGNAKEINGKKRFLNAM